MKLSTLRRRIRKYLGSKLLLLNAAFGMAYPFAEVIIIGAQSLVPQLDGVIPYHVFRWVSLGVVLLNVAIALRQVRLQPDEEAKP